MKEDILKAILKAIAFHDLKKSDYCGSKAEEDEENPEIEKLNKLYGAVANWDFGEVK